MVNDGGDGSKLALGMDSLISAAARALATGDALLALKHVALRDDPPALALRGIAMAQLGELARARELLRHCDAAQRQRRRVVAQRHVLERQQRIAGGECAGGGGDQRVHPQG